MNPLEQLPIPLLEWYRDNARSLPWRDDPTPYHVWVSEMMLQQTRVAAVLDYYRRFMAERCLTWPLWPPWSEEPADEAVAGTGLLLPGPEPPGGRPADHGGTWRFLSLRLCRRYAPSTGVGDYTAGAICSIAFGQPVPAVDGNVLRVVTRVTGDEGDITTPAMKAKVAAHLAPIIPLDAPRRLHPGHDGTGRHSLPAQRRSIMCRRAQPRSFCTARLENRVDMLPVKTKKKARRVEERTVWLIFHEGRVALRRRAGQGFAGRAVGVPQRAVSRFPAPGMEESPPCPTSTAVQAKHIFTHIEWHMTARVVEAGCGILCRRAGCGPDRAQLRRGVRCAQRLSDGVEHLVDDQAPVDKGRAAP